jgi:hypothetical protein
VDGIFLGLLLEKGVCYHYHGAKKPHAIPRITFYEEVLLLLISMFLLRCESLGMNMKLVILFSCGGKWCVMELVEVMQIQKKIRTLS